MKYKTAWFYYLTNKAIAAAAGVTGAAVTDWKKAGIIPRKHAERLEAHSGGEVRVDALAYIEAERVALMTRLGELNLEERRLRDIAEPGETG